MEAEVQVTILQEGGPQGGAPGGGPGPDDPNGNGGNGGLPNGSRHTPTFPRDEVPIAKEAERIQVPPLPNSVNFLRWLRQVADEVASASPFADDAQRWIMSVLVTSFDDLGGIPPKFTRLDMKLKAALKRIADHGILATDIDTKTSELEKVDLILRGMQILWLIKEANKVDEKSAHLFGFNDMNKVRLIGDDLAGMIATWEATLERCQGCLDTEHILQPMLYGLIERYEPLRPAVEYYDRIEPDDPDKSYAFLLNACKKLINKRVVTVNRGQVQQVIASGNAVAKPLNGQKMFPSTSAAGQEVAQGGSSPTGESLAGISPLRIERNLFDKTDAIARKLCFAFQNGKCTKKAGECIFGHEPAKKAQSRRKGSPSPNRGPKSESPCIFFSKGMCNAGDRCEYNHSGATGTPAASDDKKINGS